MGRAVGPLEPGHAGLGGQAGLATLERLPAYAPEPNPVEGLWSAIKTRELANLAGDHLADVADAAERGVRRVCSSEQLPYSFLTHTGPTISPQTPQN
ncbi:transposase [Streptomyces beigongshangae]|uniref:transposase n=1 Tax=Streptomyces beigongshangae TaxID=2841597 RepID=UPI0027E1B49C|nr:transposase [Streptomyces sp. REN17]